MSRWLARASLVAAGVVAAGCSERSGHDPYALMEGQGIYQAECAACHGARLEGQTGGQAAGADGKPPAPRLDASGRAWQLTREQLAATVKFGAAPPAATRAAPPEPGSAVPSGMPAFAGTLSDAQVGNVLAWIESQWPPELLAQRAEKLKPR